MSDESFMRAALAEAVKARVAGEVPVGSVVVVDGSIAGVGFNRPISSHDPTAHAEIVALRAAAARVGNYRLTGSTLYVTTEPCLMCVGAMVHARVGRVVYGATEPKAGAIVSMTRAHELPGLNHRLDVDGGVLEDDCRALMQEFFRERRAATTATDPLLQGFPQARHDRLAPLGQAYTAILGSEAQPAGGLGLVVGRFAIRREDVKAFEAVVAALSAVAATDLVLGDKPITQALITIAAAVFRLLRDLRAHGAWLDADALRVMTILLANVRSPDDAGLTPEEVAGVIQRISAGVDAAWVSGQLARLVAWNTRFGPRALVAESAGRWRPLV